MQEAVATSFDLFGTLAAAERPADPATAVARALRERGVSVPEDWSEAYREPHRELPAGAEGNLAEHVHAALESRGVDVPKSTVQGATLAAFDRSATRRDCAMKAVEAARVRGPVGVLSNCSVPGLVERTLDRTALPEFDAVVASVDCGWRKPDPRAFEAIANELGVETGQLRHVGDDPDTDGGVEEVGGTAILVEDTREPEVHDELRRIA